MYSLQLLCLIHASVQSATCRSPFTAPVESVRLCKACRTRRPDECDRSNGVQVMPRRQTHVAAISSIRRLESFKFVISIGRVRHSSALFTHDANSVGSELSVNAATFAPLFTCIFVHQGRLKLCYV